MKLIFNNVFYLTQFTQSIIITPWNLYQNCNEMIYILFFIVSLDNLALIHIYSISWFRLATFQGLAYYMWLSLWTIQFYKFLFQQKYSKTTQAMFLIWKRITVYHKTCQYHFLDVRPIILFFIFYSLPKQLTYHKISNFAPP